jgi:hypothetical protein
VKRDSNLVTFYFLLFTFYFLLPFYFLQAQPYRLRVDSLRVDYKFYVGATDRFPFFGYLNSNNRVTSTTIEDGAIQNVDITNPNITFNAADGLEGTGGQIDLGGNIAFQVNVDNQSIEITNDTLNVKAGGITNAMLENSSLGISAGSGLSGGGTPNLGESVVLNMNIDNSTFEINGSNELSLKTSAITTVKIADTNVTTAKIADEAITWEKLAQMVRTVIGNNLYDFQDAAVNPKWQMHVRWAHYLHERFYNETKRAYVVPYDDSGDNFLETRRPLDGYMQLLKSLHEVTDNQIYLNRLIVLADALLDSCNTVNHAVTGGRFCYSVPQELTDAEGWNSLNWAHNDVPFHLELLYIYQQNPTQYANYLNLVKDFADVAYSRITKSGITGWGWGYGWVNDTPDADTRINTVTVWLPLWATLKAENILTTDITTTATYDSLLDSIHAFINTAWIHTTSGGEEVAGLALTPNHSTINLSYNSALADFWEVGEILSDTGWFSGCSDSMELVAAYYTNPIGQNYLFQRGKHNLRTAFILKENAKWGKTNLDTMLNQAWIADALYPGAFHGDTWQSGNLIEEMRFGQLRLGRDLALMLRRFNDSTFVEDFLFPYVSKNTAPWSPSVGNFYLIDGYYIVQDNWIGLVNNSISTYYYVVGFRTEDTSPNCADTTTWVLDNNKVLTWTYPTQANGLTYTVKKRMATPFMKIIPSAPDSIRLETPHTGTAPGDSVFLFYYDQNLDLQHIRLGGVSVGDSITGIRGDLGVFAGTVREPGSVSWDGGAGFICNKTNMRLIKTSDNLLNRKVFTTSAQILPDSAIVYSVDHNHIGLGLESGGDFSKTNLMVIDILEAAQRYWNYGMGTEGILEDKTN